MFPTSPMFPEEVGGYRLPNCHQNEDDLLRLSHADLVYLDAEGFKVEHYRVRNAWMAAYGTRVCIYTLDIQGFALAVEWLLERLTAIDIESRRRRRSA